MLVEERRQQVLDLVKGKGFVTLADLAEEVRASLKLHVVGPAITGRRLSAPGVSLGVARSGQDVEAI